MTPAASSLALATLAFAPMIGEALLSARNERRLRQQGAVEPPDDVFAAMQATYPTSFAAMVAEHWIRQPSVDGITVAGAVVFGAAKALKYWAIATLGPRWTFRVLVPPDSTPIRTGPYRVARHPNYIAVVGELAGVAVMAHAWITAPLAMGGFILLMRRRIVIEERALGLRKV